MKNLADIQSDIDIQVVDICDGLGIDIAKVTGDRAHRLTRMDHRISWNVVVQGARAVEGVPRLGYLQHKAGVEELVIIMQAVQVHQFILIDVVPACNAEGEFAFLQCIRGREG